MTIESLHEPSNYFQQRCTATDCTNRQHRHFRIITRASSIQKPVNSTKGARGISLQDMNGVLRSGLKVTNLNHALVREHYFDNPAGTLTHLKFSSIVHRPEEEIEFLIDATDWLIPTGGLTSAGANVEYNWDIFVDGIFYGNFRGYSGHKSAGIFVKKPTEYLAGPIVFLKDVEAFDSEFPFTTSVPLSSPNNYGYLPYWFSVTRDGQIFDSAIGVYSHLSLERLDSVFRVTYKPSADSAANNLIIYQCVAIFPIKDNVTRDDIATYRLEIKPHESFTTPKSVCPATPPEMVVCPDFVVQYATTQSLIPCQLPYRYGSAGYGKHVPAYTSPHQMRVVIRPRSNYPLEQGWLRGYGFCDEIESHENWNSPSNKDKLIKVRSMITPETVCINCTHTGNFAFRSWFDGCRRLQEADLSYHADWRTITHAGDMFGYRMFYGCSSLQNIGILFSEPQSLISCGDDFNRYKFANCTALRYVSEEYTEPYHLKETGSAFCANQFSGCRSLAYVSPYYTDKFSIPSPQYQDSVIRQPGNGHLAHKWDATWT